MKRILFVDDEPRILDGLRDMLRRERKRWDMVFALGGEAALAECERQPFDVLVSDMRMPQMDGAQLLTRVRERYPGTVRIILSGHTEPEAAMRAVPVAHQFLAKPCDATTLTRTIERACAMQGRVQNDAMRRLLGLIDGLPPRPRVYSDMLALLQDGGGSTAQLARVLERDLALGAKLLQLVNSAFFGAPRHITRIEDAVAYVGQRTILDLAVSVSAFSSPTPVAGLSLDALQRRSFVAGRVAQSLVQDETLRDEAFLAGMLQDIGMLTLAARLPAHWAAALGSIAAVPRPLHAVEHELWGVTHADVGAYLLGLWGLPDRVVEAVARHHDPRAAAAEHADLVAATYLAGRLARECDTEAVHPDVVALEALDVAYLADTGLADRVDETRARVRELAAGGQGG